MSVYTRVSADALQELLGRLELGELRAFEGISSGIENSNYFVETTCGRYVLTLFEHMAAAEIPFYIGLNEQLYRQGLPTACACADARGEQVFELHQRPAIVVPRLEGKSPEAPSPAQCSSLGEALARMHAAMQGQTAPRDNARGLPWLEETAARVMPFLSDEDAQLLREQVALQGSEPFTALPGGIIHADLFRDNTLFVGDRLTGLLDFYLAGEGAFVYDLAIAANDWCVNEDASLDEARLTALLAGYQSRRSLKQAERDQWQTALQAGALRFWVSRLDDSLAPREGEMVLSKDPDEFRRILLARREAVPGIAV